VITPEWGDMSAEIVAVHHGLQWRGVLSWTTQEIFKHQNAVVLAGGAQVTPCRAR
jgi:hypothetical protein